MRTLAFLRAARTYWFGVYPHVARELRGWRERAASIEDPVLRAQALAALDKRGNMEGAAAFATFVPRRARARVARATVAFQAAYNHLDVLSERPGSDPQRSGRMHQALLDALDDARPVDYGAGERDAAGDGGYLAALVGTCREAVAGLPSYPVLAPVAQRAAERVIGFQAHQAVSSAACAGDERIAAWAHGLTPAGADLRWWEVAAAAGSSLGVHAAIALAATPGVTPAEAQAIHDAYFPWIAALHSMLDHLVDAAEDRCDGQRNLIERYASREEAAERMALLAERALAAARAYPTGGVESAPGAESTAGAESPRRAESPRGAESSPGRARTHRKPRRTRAHRHELVVAAMASFYLADPGARTPETAPIANAVLGRFGALANGPLAVFRGRGWVENRRRARLRRSFALGPMRALIPPGDEASPTLAAAAAPRNGLAGSPGSGAGRA